MNEYKVYSRCKTCHQADTWYLNTEFVDKESVLAEARECLSRAMSGGYYCQHCEGSDIELVSVVFDPYKD